MQEPHALAIIGLRSQRYRRDPDPDASRAMKSSRRASFRPADRARLSEQKLANRRPSTVTTYRFFSICSIPTMWARTEKLARGGFTPPL
jgi:hypothetical protein